MNKILLPIFGIKTEPSYFYYQWLHDYAICKCNINKEHIFPAILMVWYYVCYIIKQMYSRERTQQLPIWENKLIVKQKREMWWNSVKFVCYTKQNTKCLFCIVIKIIQRTEKMVIEPLAFNVYST